jgi:hypothetical protein
MNDSERRVSTSVIDEIYSMLLEATPSLIAFLTKVLNDPKAKPAHRRWAADALVRFIPPEKEKHAPDGPE